MGVKHGLSVNGVKYFSDFLKEEQRTNWTTRPDWMQMGKVLAKMTGHYELLNFMTNIKGLEQFALMGQNWTIGGMLFDGIMHTEHSSRVRPTTYPVQTGVTMTDHAIIEPAELSIEIMMTDTKTGTSLQWTDPGMSSPILSMPSVNNPGAGILGSLGSGVGGGIFGNRGSILGAAGSTNSWLKGLYSNFNDLPCMPSANFVVTGGDGRSVAAWKSLRALQLSRVPVTVKTRLGDYSNMIIEELSVPDDYKTLHALRCTVRLREIIFAEVAETEVSARSAANKATSSGQVPAQTGSDVDKTAAAKIGSTIG